MSRFLSSLPIWAAALWWGSLTTIGFLVVPMLFAHLATPAIAGQMAARLFTAQTWVSVVCTLLLLLATGPAVGGVAQEGQEAQTAPSAAMTAPRLSILAGLLLALLVEFVVAPRIVARENLALWHRLGSACYLVQWLCAGWTLWRLSQNASQRRI
jgi:hypothetical protein